MIGPYERNRVAVGDCMSLVKALPDESVHVAVTSPPYWGQRTSLGMGVEPDPREYVEVLVSAFRELRPKLARDGIMWLNLGDAYNTNIRWGGDTYRHSTLGRHASDGPGDEKLLPPTNSAYTKPRAARNAFVDQSVPWLVRAGLLALPQRVLIALCDDGWVYRGEVVWHKPNPLPEGRCRRPHRAHELVMLFARSTKHGFRVAPPVRSVWRIPFERPDGVKHMSRFPIELPKQCIEAYGRTGEDVVVLDMFAGSGSTGCAAVDLGCTFVGFEIDADYAKAANQRIIERSAQHDPSNTITVTGLYDNSGRLPSIEVCPTGECSLDECMYCTVKRAARGAT